VLRRRGIPLLQISRRTCGFVVPDDSAIPIEECQFTVGFVQQIEGSYGG
jgi:hypothetical protein